MVRKLLFLISLTLSFTQLYAQQHGSLKGTITSQNGKPLSGVSVGLKGKGNATSTNSQGKFSFNKLSPGDYTIRVSYIGTKIEERQVSVNTNETTEVTIALNESAEGLNEVEINDKKRKYKAEKVSSSLRLDGPLLETPQNIQVVTSAAIADQQIISMNDGILRNVSGATKLEHWGNLYTRVNMRGSRASAFRNGMNVTSSWGPLNEDMSFVDRIEFVKGPAGFMMSNGEPSGIYNVVTKKPTGQDFNGEASMTLGSYDLFRAAVDLDGKLNKSGSLLYRLNVMAQGQNSFRPYEFNNRTSIAPVITYKIDDKTSITAEYTYQFAKLSNLGSFYVFGLDGYASTPRNLTLTQPGLDPTKINDHSAFLYLNHQIDDQWKLTAQLGYFNYQQTGSSAWVSAFDIDARDPYSVNAPNLPKGDPNLKNVTILPNGSLMRSISIWDAANESKFGQVFVNGDVQTGFVHHRVLAGLDFGNKRYIADFGQSLTLDSRAKFFNIYNPVYTTPANGLPHFDRSKSLEERGIGNLNQQSYSGIYLQDELGFLDNQLRLTLAGRYTYVKEQSGVTVKRESKKFTPRIGLSGNIDESTTAYALFDQSFVPQSGNLRSGGTPKPITGNNMEIGLKREWFNKNLITSISAYRILKNNTLAADIQAGDPAGTAYVIELGQNKTQGIEFDMNGKVSPSFDVIANYAYTDSEVSKASAAGPAGTKVPGYAKHNVNVWLVYTVQNGLLKGSGLNGGFNFQGDRSTWTWTGATGQKALPDYYKFDGGVFWGKNKIKVTLAVNNLLDRYLYSGSAYANYYYWQTEAGRNYRLGINYKF